jgi:hypothetical protein
MDDHSRTRLKIGVHELEVEGPTIVVQEQVKKFLELVATLPPEQVSPPVTVPTESKPMTATIATPSPVVSPSAVSIHSADVNLDKIMRVDNRVISLTARPDNAESAILLLLYGQKMLRQNDGVTGAEVMEGITATGGLDVPRVDRLLEKMGRDGDVIVIGERRGKRYRLTNTGLTKARSVASQLIRIVA